MPRKISAHVELAGIAWRRDWLGRSKEFEFIAKVRRAFPTNLPDCTRRFSFTFEFNRLQLEQERCESARRNLWFIDHASHRCYDARPLAKFVGELLACGVCCCEFVQQEKTSHNQEICRSQLRPAERNQDADSENYSC